MVWCSGHYIPQLAVAILDHNKHSTGFKFNLKGVAVRPHILLITCSIVLFFFFFFFCLLFCWCFAHTNFNFMVDWESTSETWSWCTGNIWILLVTWNDFRWNWSYNHERLRFWWLWICNPSQRKCSMQQCNSYSQ